MSAKHCYVCLHFRTYLAHLRYYGLILLRVVVARNPIGCMVARHCKLGVLFLHYDIVELGLLRKLIAQSHAVVVDTETNADVTLH